MVNENPPVSLYALEISKNEKVETAAEIKSEPLTMNTLENKPIVTLLFLIANTVVKEIDETKPGISHNDGHLGFQKSTVINVIDIKKKVILRAVMVVSQRITCFLFSVLTLSPSRLCIKKYDGINKTIRRPSKDRNAAINIKNVCGVTSKESLNMSGLPMYRV
ncbi:hypothetical protein C9426_09320 [Serratia sp. S1B]|nr:hypothetical protein C9426_09320 [Serratia sp. S1B]